MLHKIESFKVQNNYNPSFNAVIAKGARIQVKRRGEYIPQNVGSVYLTNLKNIFFELFPKIDPEYRKIKNI